LETPHNFFHGYVGGDMAYPAKASWDPIFWFHHCEVDRQYETWIHKFGTGIEMADSEKKIACDFPDIKVPNLAPYPKHTIIDTFDTSKYGYKYSHLVDRDPEVSLAKQARPQYYIVTEPIGMSKSTYWVRYFVKTYESTEKFDEHTPLVNNPNYAGSIYIFGMDHGEHMEGSHAEHHDHMHGSDNKAETTILVTDNEIIKVHLDRVRVIAVVVDNDGNKMEIPEEDSGLLNAEVHASVG